MDTGGLCSQLAPSAQNGLGCVSIFELWPNFKKNEKEKKNNHMLVEDLYFTL